MATKIQSSLIRRGGSTQQLDLVARASVLIQDAQALLDTMGPTLVAAHLQQALDLLRGEQPLTAGRLRTKREPLPDGSDPGQR